MAERALVWWAMVAAIAVTACYCGNQLSLVISAPIRTNMMLVHYLASYIPITFIDSSSSLFFFLFS